jgi:hypothetical protein
MNDGSFTHALDGKPTFGTRIRDERRRNTKVNFKDYSVKQRMYDVVQKGDVPPSTPAAFISTLDHHQ